MNDKYYFQNFTGNEIDTLLQGLQTNKNDITLMNDLDTKVDKVGPLPYFEINRSALVEDFLVNNDVLDKPIVIKTTIGTRYASLIGYFTGSIPYLVGFELDDLGGNKRYYSNRVNISSKTFGDLLSSTYEADFECQNNKVTSVSASSTDNQYPSAKCLWDNKGTKLYQHKFGSYLYIISTKPSYSGSSDGRTYPLFTQGHIQAFYLYNGRVYPVIETLYYTVPSVSGTVYFQTPDGIQSESGTSVGNDEVTPL